LAILAIGDIGDFRLVEIGNWKNWKLKIEHQNGRFGL